VRAVLVAAVVLLAGLLPEVAGADGRISAAAKRRVLAAKVSLKAALDVVAQSWDDFQLEVRSRVRIGAPASPARSAPASPATPRPTAAPPPSGRAAGPDYERLVKRVDATHFEVDRRLLDEARNDPGLARSVRIVPALKGVRVNGFKVYAFAPGSLWERLGLVSGDTIHRVSGHDITSVDDALEVYAQLKTADQAQVELVRANAPLTLEYRLK